MLRHFMIIRSQGVPLFSFTNKMQDPHYQSDNALSNQNPDSLVKNDTLFSGLVSSFSSFAKELGGSLQQIKLDNVDLYLYEQNSLIGVSLTDPSNEPEDIKFYEKATQKITDKFHSTYREDLTKWDGNVSKFDSFIDHLNVQDLLDDNINPDKVCLPCLLECCEENKLLV